MKILCLSTINFGLKIPAGEDKSHINDYEKKYIIRNVLWNAIYCVCTSDLSYMKYRILKFLHFGHYHPCKTFLRHVRCQIWSEDLFRLRIIVIAEMYFRNIFEFLFIFYIWLNASSFLDAWRATLDLFIFSKLHS